MRHLPDVLAVIGAALVVWGVALMHVPSALVLAGVVVVLAGYTLYKAQA